MVSQSQRGLSCFGQTDALSILQRFHSVWDSARLRPSAVRYHKRNRLFRLCNQVRGERNGIVTWEEYPDLALGIQVSQSALGYLFRPRTNTSAFSRQTGSKRALFDGFFSSKTCMTTTTLARVDNAMVESQMQRFSAAPQRSHLGNNFAGRMGGYVTT